MEALFEQLQDDTRSFWQNPSAGGGRGIRRLDAMPSPDDFFRDYVATSTPVVISSGGTASSPAACFKAAAGDAASRGSAWDDVSTLIGRRRRRRSALDDDGDDDNDDGLEVTVDFTPDGRGDCVVDVARSNMVLSSSDHCCGSNGSGGGGSSSSNSGSNGSNGNSGRGGGSGTGEVGETGQGSGNSVNHTGDAAAGLGNDSTTAVFVKPEERRVNFETFLGMLSEKSTAAASSVSSVGSGSSSSTPRSSSDDTVGEVPYLSHQVRGAHRRTSMYYTCVLSCAVKPVCELRHVC